VGGDLSPLSTLRNPRGPLIMKEVLIYRSKYAVYSMLKKVDFIFIQVDVQF